ncbi:DUF5057 domain-containing protein [Paenibacillus sp. sgz302251]|uniref:DUF5057 domain-containing protein n=1 Tax=Paenibacillus sp. sgz302251 TaxID=3414493 RepID=UPI003C7A7ABA
MKISLWQRRVSILVSITVLAMIFTYIGASPKQIQAAVNLTAVTLSYNSKYVSIKDDAVTAAADHVFFNELLELEDHGNHIYSIKSKISGKYLSYSSSDNGYQLAALSKSPPSSKEKFERIDNTDGTVSFRTVNEINSAKRYVEVSSGVLKANSKTTNNNQKFQLATLHLRPTVNVLEITETGASDLTPLIGGQSLISIKTYSMKQFVASREQLDGKYDAIYIGRGTYNISLPTQTATASAHQTKDKQNDITQLKASEIITKFVDKGLPVILYSDISRNAGIEFQADLWSGNHKEKEALLKKNFAKYNSDGNRRNNVIFVNDAQLSSTNAFVSQINLLVKGNLRPLLSLIEQPIGYTSSSNHKYTAGDMLTFKYAVDNLGDISAKDINVNLYIGMDSAVPFEVEQLVATQRVTGDTGTLTYKLPRGFSGLQYWKLELTDFSNPLKDVKTGVYRFQDEKIHIKVLQVMPQNNSNSDLTKSTNINSQYLAPTDGNNKDAYSIQIDPMPITTFNSTGYQTLNGKYDMLIFGFRDEYNNYAPINEEAAAAVQTFIGTGQSVMFTHDTIYVNNNSQSRNWLNKFQTVTGQIAPRTDMGFGGPVKSTKTEKVNDGLLTQFPFLLSNSTSVATTHNQYFTLDLEDPAVIPWYNMTDSSYRTAGDSWNHYYTYSKGNVTYSGSGHTNSNFPDWEQQLFVNTMYRAYMGSNHAPQLTVYSPIEYNQTENNFIPSYSDILINYKIDDFDLNDRQLTTSINLKYSGTTVPILTSEKVLSGTTMNHQVANPMPEGGLLTVEIIVRDAQGAEARKEINVKIVKVTSNLELSRTVSDNVVENKIETNDTAAFTYTITPKAIDKNDALAADRMKITGLTFTEQFPPDLEIGTLPSGFTKRGNLETGFTVSGTLADIPYRLSDNKYTASPVSFTIPVTPKKDNPAYSLMNAALAYKDIGSQTSMTLQFPPYILEAITKIKELTINNKTILIGDQWPMETETIIKPDTATKKQLTWVSDRPDIVTVNSRGIIQGIAAGTAALTATTTDGSGITARAKITVITAGLNINGPDRVSVHESISLTSSLITADYEQIETYAWSIGSGGANVSLNGTSSNTATVRGMNTATATISLKVTTNQIDPKTNRKREYTASKQITVYKKLTSIDLTGTTLMLGQSAQLTPAFTPADATDKSITWRSDNPNIVSVDQNGTVKGEGTGQATITVTAADGSGLSKNAIVYVTLPKPVITGRKEVDLGTVIPLSAHIKWANNDPIASDDGVVWRITGGSSNAQLINKTDTSAELKGIRAGSVNVIVTVNTKGGRTYASEPIEVTVNPVSLYLYNTMTIDLNETMSLWDELQSSPAAGKTNIQSSLAWKSSDNETVSVNPSTGAIKGLKPGSSTITVTYSHDPALTARTTIIVMRPDEPPVNPEIPGGGFGRY